MDFLWSPRGCPGGIKEVTQSKGMWPSLGGNNVVDGAPGKQSGAPGEQSGAPAPAVERSSLVSISSSDEDAKVPILDLSFPPKQKLKDGPISRPIKSFTVYW